MRRTVEREGTSAVHAAEAELWPAGERIVRTALTLTPPNYVLQQTGGDQSLGCVPASGIARSRSRAPTTFPPQLNAGVRQQQAGNEMMVHGSEWRVSMRLQRKPSGWPRRAGEYWRPMCTWAALRGAETAVADARRVDRGGGVAAWPEACGSVILTKAAV
jgi:hypothetical protein